PHVDDVALRHDGPPFVLLAQRLARVRVQLKERDVPEPRVVRAERESAAAGEELHRGEAVRGHRLDRSQARHFARPGPSTYLITSPTASPGVATPAARWMRRSFGRRRSGMRSTAGSGAGCPVRPGRRGLAIAYARVTGISPRLIFPHRSS